MGDLAGRLVRGITPWPDAAGEALLRNSACPEDKEENTVLAGWSRGIGWGAKKGAREGPETTAFLELT